MTHEYDFVRLKSFSLARAQGRALVELHMLSQSHQSLPRLRRLRPLLGCCSNEEHVVTPDEDLSEFASHLSVDEFLCVGELEVHVGVCGDEESGVFHAPLESDGHLFPGEFGEEWFGVDWDKLWWGVEDVVVRRASVLFCSGGFERIVRKLRLFGEDWFVGGSTCL
jgi:hypothetical protein